MILKELFAIKSGYYPATGFKHKWDIGIFKPQYYHHQLWS